MTKPNPWLWPKRCSLIISDGWGKELCRTKDRRLDLSDTVMSYSGWSERTVYIGFAPDPGAPSLGADARVRLEALIRDDFAHDGFGTTLNYLGGRGEQDHLWKVRVRPKV